MPILGQKVWGRSGVAFDIANELRWHLIDDLDTPEDADFDYDRRTVESKFIYKGTPITITTNSSLPGYGTIRWDKSKGSANTELSNIVLGIANRHDISEDKVIRALK